MTDRGVRFAPLQRGHWTDCQFENAQEAGVVSGKAIGVVIGGHTAIEGLSLGGGIFCQRRSNGESSSGAERKQELDVGLEDDRGSVVDG